MKKTISLLILLLSLFYASKSEAVLLEQLFWTDTPVIRSSSLDGTNVTTLSSGNIPRFLDIDETNKKIYWTAGSCSGMGCIKRSNLDGTNIETVIGGLIYPQKIKLDVANNYLYWSDKPILAIDSYVIRRSNLDGSNLIDVTQPSPGDLGLELDLFNGYMYWGTVDNSSLVIKRANLDGVNVSMTSNIDALTNFTVDAEKGYIYAIVGTKIKRMNLDGSNSLELISGIGNPYDITLDSTKEFLFWSDTDKKIIQRMNLNNFSTIDLIDQLNFPRGVATGAFDDGDEPVVPELSTVLLFSAGLLGAFVRRRKRS